MLEEPASFFLLCFFVEITCEYVISQVEYSGGFSALNPHRFGQLFVNRVANTKDILLFFRKKASYSRGDCFL